MKNVKRSGGVFGWIGLIIVAGIIGIMSFRVVSIVIEFGGHVYQWQKQKLPSELSLDIELLGSMKVTSYRAVPWQTKPTGYEWTASGEKVNVHGVAVSQDMLKRKGGVLEFGDMVYIEEIGLKFVNDVMHSRHKKQFDVLVQTYTDEKKFDEKFRGKKIKVWLIRTTKGERK
jgi:3D (Asp-Asp-Asp) domain-containing protein